MNLDPIGDLKSERASSGVRDRVRYPMRDGRISETDIGNQMSEVCCPLSEAGRYSPKWTRTVKAPPS